MITQEMARAIYSYTEIITAEKLLADIEEVEKRQKEERHEEYRRNGIRNSYNDYYQLSVPNMSSSRDTSMRLFGVNPSMAKSIIISHQASQKALLVELNQMAKIELETKEGDDAPKTP